MTPTARGAAIQSGIIYQVLKFAPLVWPPLNTFLSTNSWVRTLLASDCWASLITCNSGPPQGPGVLGYMGYKNSHVLSINWLRLAVILHTRERKHSFVRAHTPFRITTKVKSLLSTILFDTWLNYPDLIILIKLPRKFPVSTEWYSAGKNMTVKG